jgi:hypothetical protein
VSFLTEHLGIPTPSPTIWRRSAPPFAARWRRSPRQTGSRWCGSPERPQDRGDAALSGPSSGEPEGLVWPRSGWPRSSRRFTPRSNTPGTYRGCGSPSPCPSGGHRGERQRLLPVRPINQYLTDGRALRASRPSSTTPTAASLRVQPLSGSRGSPSPRMAGGPPALRSATLGSRPWPAPYAPACVPLSASLTRACAP